MATELPRHQSLALFRRGRRAALADAALDAHRASRAIHGRPRVEEVELTDLDSGATRTRRVRHRRLHAPTGSPTTSWR